MINKQILLGRIGGIVELRNLDNGSSVAKVSLATSESWKDKKTNEWREVTEWHNLEWWGAAAEYAEKNIKKGDMVYIEGKTMHTSWEKDGNTHYKTVVKVIKTRKIPTSSGNNTENAGENQAAALGKDNATVVNTGTADELPF